MDQFLIIREDDDIFIEFATFDIFESDRDSFERKTLNKEFWFIIDEEFWIESDDAINWTIEVSKMLEAINFLVPIYWIKSLEINHNLFHFVISSE